MDTGILGGLVFVLVFAGIILLHEFGHYIVARLFKIEIEEFGIGFPPRLVRLFHWQGTDFTLNWIPLGGFVRPKGEDDPNVAGGLAAANPWKRIAVLLAGVTMNFLTAVFVYTLFFSQVGIPDRSATVLAAVAPGSPAEQAGLQDGDRILSANGVQITRYEELIEITNRSRGQPMLLVVERGGQILETSVTPRLEPPEGEGPMGIVVGNPLLPAGSWFATLPISFTAVGNDISNLLALPGRIIAGTIAPEEAQIGGPRSIWNLFQQSVARDLQSRQPGGGFTTRPTNYTLMIIISLNITIGVINLLPIPALDGGRIFMALIEIVISRRLPAKFQASVNGISFILLLFLLGFFYIKDLIAPVAFTLP